MHVFLTGAVQVGKSTVLHRTLALWSRPVYGFRTQFLHREREDRALYLLPAATSVPTPPCLVAPFVEGRPQPIPAAFDTVGSALLQEARRHPEGIILMDECGKFEREAFRFQQEIRTCLEGDIPVLGVIRQGVSGWADMIWHHPKVRILTVTEENRELLPMEVLRLGKESP